MNDGKWKMTNDKLDSVEAVAGVGSSARNFSQLQGKAVSQEPRGVVVAPAYQSATTTPKACGLCPLY